MIRAVQIPAWLINASGADLKTTIESRPADVLLVLIHNMHLVIPDESDTEARRRRKIRLKRLIKRAMTPGEMVTACLSVPDPDARVYNLIRLAKLFQIFHWRSALAHLVDAFLTESDSLTTKQKKRWLDQLDTAILPDRPRYRKMLRDKLDAN